MLTPFDESTRTQLQISIRDLEEVSGDRPVADLSLVKTCTMPANKIFRLFFRRV
jgi:hypothetical protein